MLVARAGCVHRHACRRRPTIVKGGAQGVLIRVQDVPQVEFVVEKTVHFDQGKGKSSMTIFSLVVVPLLFRLVVDAAAFLRWSLFRTQEETPESAKCS